VEVLKQILIISDGRKGHLNQSIALAKYLNYKYDVVEVNFRSKIHKAISYIFDNVGFYTMSLFDLEERFRNKFGMTNSSHHEVLPRHSELVSGSKNEYSIVVSAGSSTYYAAKVIAKKFTAKTVAMMLPRGYRYDFDLIFAQSHDNPPRLPNVIEIPANFSFIKPLGLYKPNKQSVGIIIGGNNSYLEMNKEKLKEQLDFIKKQFRDYEIAVTTSPRTPKEIEELIKTYHFDYEIIYSQNPINPIPDFLAHCDTVFITSDSTSMISESISFGEANIFILPLVSKKENKFGKFISKLETDGYLHIFDGKIINKNQKIDFTQYLKGLDL
jgi:hypothetical protein